MNSWDMIPPKGTTTENKNTSALEEREILGG